MKITDLSVRRIPPEDMADGREAIGCFVTLDDGKVSQCNVHIEEVAGKEPADVVRVLHLFAAAVGRMDRLFDDEANAA